jgi:hypothetical protein
MLGVFFLVLFVVPQSALSVPVELSLKVARKEKKKAPKQNKPLFFFSFR